MYTFLVILTIFISILLILIVLVQNPKGSGFAAGFSGMNQFGGIAQTNKMLERITWTFAILLVVLTLSATISLNTKKVEKSEVVEMVKEIDFTKAPVLPKNQPNQ